MWKPADVVDEHKGRATVIWVGIIFALCGHAGWIVRTAVKKLDNPSTSYVLSNDLYSYPDVYVCMYNFLGCDEVALEESCRNSVFETQGKTEARFNPGTENEQLIAMEPAFFDDYGFCVRLEASSAEFSGEERNPADHLRVDMFWYPGGAANSSRTCIAEEGAWKAHRESITVFLRDPDTGDMSVGTQLPYTCITNQTQERSFSHVGIGFKKEVPLSNIERTAYKSLTVITSTRKDPIWKNVTAPMASLTLEIAQTVESYEIITEIDPLERGEILGTIGGFWEILLLIWPVFFMSATSVEPVYRFREFRKSLSMTPRKQ